MLRLHKIIFFKCSGNTSEGVLKISISFRKSEDSTLFDFLCYLTSLLYQCFFLDHWKSCQKIAMNKLKCDLQWKEKRVYWWFTYYICLPLTETWLVQTTSITTINRIFEKGGGGSLSYHDILSQDFTIFMVKQKKKLRRVFGR